MMGAEKLLGSEIAHGDERERAVYTAGGALGMHTGMYLCFAAALVFALFGHILVPFVLIVLAAVPSLIAISYAERRGVDAFDILARGRAGASAASGVVVTIILLLISAAMIYTSTSGRGLLEFEFTEAWAERFGSFGNGAAVGGAFGAVGGYLWTVWLIRRRRKQQQKELSVPDRD
ncbi:hypothetical protein [Nesterenkonia muleiensis]|uniref:hypothetical protein n=1 Tax=Nesterenkonia muleiensis TaxID=2282648 RepID=UPI000E709249|nr:hypothetical protein [Nesterenkonia muleiensis]